MEEKKVNKTADVKQYMKEYNKSYYVKNKEKLDNYYAVKVQCECGMMVRKNNLPGHRTKGRHIKKINASQEDILNKMKQSQEEFEKKIRGEFQELKAEFIPKPQEVPEVTMQVSDDPDYFVRRFLFRMTQ